jgi:hypothetical protein
MIWWRQQVLVVVKEEIANKVVTFWPISINEMAEFFFAKCKLVLRLGGGSRSLLCWEMRRLGFAFV